MLYRIEMEVQSASQNAADIAPSGSPRSIATGEDPQSQDAHLEKGKASRPKISVQPLCLSGSAERKPSQPDRETENSLNTFKSIREAQIAGKKIIPPPPPSPGHLSKLRPPPTPQSLATPKAPAWGSQSSETTSKTENPITSHPLLTTPRTKSISMSTAPTFVSFSTVQNTFGNVIDGNGDVVAPQAATDQTTSDRSNKTPSLGGNEKAEGDENTSDGPAKLKRKATNTDVFAELAKARSRITAPTPNASTSSSPQAFKQNSQEVSKTPTKASDGSKRNVVSKTPTETPKPHSTAELIVPLETSPVSSPPSPTIVSLVSSAERDRTRSEPGSRPSLKTPGAKEVSPSPPPPPPPAHGAHGDTSVTPSSPDSGSGANSSSQEASQQPPTPTSRAPGGTPVTPSSPDNGGEANSPSPTPPPPPPSLQAPTNSVEKSEAENTVRKDPSTPRGNSCSKCSTLHAQVKTLRRDHLAMSEAAMSSADESSLLRDQLAEARKEYMENKTQKMHTDRLLDVIYKLKEQLDHEPIAPELILELQTVKEKLLYMTIERDDLALQIRQMEAAPKHSPSAMTRQGWFS